MFNFMKNFFRIDLGEEAKKMKLEPEKGKSLFGQYVLKLFI